VTGRYRVSVLVVREAAFEAGLFCRLPLVREAGLEPGLRGGLDARRLCRRRAPLSIAPLHWLGGRER
jgi:hypothetical protein